MRLKQGVKLNGIQPQTVVGMMIVQSIMQDPRCPEFVITSCSDSQHGLKSKHWTGQAFDMRCRTFSTQELRDEILIRMIDSLGHDFDVVDEDDHFHIEWDPSGKP